MEPWRSGKSGMYLRVLKWLSEYGLSSETWGRLWVLVTPKSAINSATGFEVIEVPRSAWIDRKSTRLNSSHLGISYAVFCLKKKKQQDRTHQGASRRCGMQHTRRHAWCV